ncbi:unnamed protein product [Caenorhabditis sp. 36 PRJEB53466]|nr:unnamed protein product [Caenorhabditis sp. 36 PRJEB53466]
MSEGHPSTTNAACSVNSSALKSTQKAHAESGEQDEILPLCVNEIPWKLVPQISEDYIEYEYLDEDERLISDAESFVWKWSNCGRYGIDLPGGRDIISQRLKNCLAVFDLNLNSWTLYKMNIVPFEIPRVCFIYWARSDIVVLVSLVKSRNSGPDDEIVLKFKQTFFYISHETKTLTHCGACKYRTQKTIPSSYWYHIFENRRGEPFIDHNNDAWLVFSNGKDCLILLPYIPTNSCYQAKCVTFDMNEIVSSLLGSRVYLDPFISNHYVPWVYRDEINFFIRIDPLSFSEEHDRDYVEGRLNVADVPREKRGLFQIRINLKDVIERGEKLSGDVEDTCLIETKFTRKDVLLWRKIAEDGHGAHECMSQHGKTVVLLKWAHDTIDVAFSKRLNTRISDIEVRGTCCVTEKRDFSFCTIDLNTDKIKKINTLVLGTDVVLPHPSGSVFMFRYKEIYAMTFCELPYFEPISLQMKCIQAISGVVQIDPDSYSSQCCLKYSEVDDAR